MQKKRIFGKLPESFAIDPALGAGRLRAWVFFDAEDQPHPSPGGGDAGYVAEVSQQELDDLRHGLASALPDEVPEALPEAVSLDLPLQKLEAAAGQCWIAGGLFATRRAALAAIGAPGAGKPRGGENIGVTLLDAGVDRHYINAIAGRAAYGGGWGRAGERPLIPGRARDPHRRPAAGHGNMIARNILSLAPFATLYDAPILPPMIHDMHGFSSDAVAVLESIRAVIENREANPAWPAHDRWILVNAWAVATSFADSGAHPPYADDRSHILNRHLIDLARLEGVDIVFAAGNSGTFQPAPFSGPYDRGPARSIWGANGLPEVFTIGAVRVDGLAIGASSQGPSRPGLVDGLEGELAGRNFPTRGAERPGHAPARPDGRMPSVRGANESGHLRHAQGTGAPQDAPINRKPDFVMPSWFGEVEDPGLANTGTSAASALFAGALAALRSGGEARPAPALKAALIAGAGNGGRWNAQTGYGLPDFTPTPAA